MSKSVLKRVLSGIVGSATMLASVPAYAAISTVAADQNVILSTDFEDGDVSAFSKRGDDDTSVITAESKDGNTFLMASERSQSWNGPQLPLNKLCEAGGQYILSCDVKSAWYATITVSMQITDPATGESSYNNLTNVVSQGEWVSIKNFKFNMPSDADVYLYFECSDANIDICIDNFNLVEAEEVQIQQDIPSLKNVYGNYFKIGTATTEMELAPKATKNLIRKHFNSITLGNELKPDSLLRQDAMQALGSETDVVVNLSKARSILNFARDNNIPVRGHVLVWHSQTPDWFFKEGYSNDGDWVSKDVMLQRMENYIKAVFEALDKEYPDVEFYAWDVVNEAWTDSGTPRQPGGQGSSGSENSAWVKVFGDNSFIEYAFKYARQYARPETKLYYNDYNEYMTGKMQAIVEMATSLKEKGLIDGIGMQSHLDVRQGQDAFPSISMYENAVKTYTSTGLDVQITELDATIPEYGANDSSFKAQAQYYSDLFDVLVKYSDNISAVVFWGTLDNTSWRSTKYPLLFNEDYTAKPAFDAIVDGIQYTEPDTTEPTTADEKADLYGDADCDGSVAVNDAILVLQSLANPSKYSLSKTGKLNADCNKPGNGVDAEDALAIQQACADMASLPIK